MPQRFHRSRTFAIWHLTDAGVRLRPGRAAILSRRPGISVFGPVQTGCCQWASTPAHPSISSAPVDFCAILQNLRGMLKHTPHVRCTQFNQSYACGKTFWV